ncbi:MAG TPA: hypothetical protein VF173_30510 [Thermoanaerobaculia bacterium]|nr:hypothetical protein [Thermoanaerobaculia bacterium]
MTILAIPKRKSQIKAMMRNQRAQTPSAAGLPQAVRLATPASATRTGITCTA